MASSQNLQNNTKINSNIKKDSGVAILSIIEKSYINRNNIPEENYEIPDNLYKSEENKEISDNNITLYNALYNSLINKDHKSFLFCIKQENEILIEETVLKMNSDCVSKFMEKSVDIFQSNSFYCNYILPWVKKIIKHKKFFIMSKKNIENLKQIQIFIQNKIKNFDALCILKQKINKINQILYKEEKNPERKINEKNKDINKDINNDNNKPIIFEPLLTYYESDDEDEIKLQKEKKNKMEIEGFEEVEKNDDDNNNEGNINFNSNNDDDKEESEEDDLDYEIDNMFKDDNEIHKNKKFVEQNNDNEENEDEDIEEDDDNDINEEI